MSIRILALSMLFLSCAVNAAPRLTWVCRGSDKYTYEVHVDFEEKSKLNAVVKKIDNAVELATQPGTYQAAVSGFFGFIEVLGTKNVMLLAGTDNSASSTGTLTGFVQMNGATKRTSISCEGSK